MYTFVVDEENNGDTWWTAARIAPGPTDPADGGARPPVAPPGGSLVIGAFSSLGWLAPLVLFEKIAKAHHTGAAPGPRIPVVPAGRFR